MEILHASAMLLWFCLLLCLHTDKQKMIRNGEESNENVEQVFYVNIQICSLINLYS